MANQATGSMIDHLSHKQRDELEALGTSVRYLPGTTIFWEGQPSRSVLIIGRGHVKVTRRAPDGSDVILAIRGPEYIMGDEGVLMHEVRSATVTSINEVVGLDVEAEDLLEFVHSRELWPLMYKAAVLRRRQSEEEVILTRPDSVKSRLARWLLQLAAELNDEVDGGWQIVSSQQELAGRVGASRDAIAAELGRLRKDGLITSGRQRIILHDLEAIRKIAAHNR